MCKTPRLDTQPNRVGVEASHLEASSQELVLHFQEVAFIRLRLERLVDDGELWIVLDVLPPSVAVTGRVGSGVM